MFEMGARPHPPQALYRSYLEQSDVFVGIYWQSYGWVGPDMEISGLQDEFDLSRAMPRLVYVKRPAPDIEPRLSEMLAGLQDGDSVSYKPFATVEQLRDLVLDDLALLLTERFAGADGSAAASEPAAPPEPTTRLVGRDEDVEAVVQRLLAGERLITLTGVGGVGKTRLSVAVLSRLRDQRVRRTAFVDLSSVADPADVLDAIASGIGARPEGSESALAALVRRLSEEPWTVVLDNLEQVAAAAPDLGLLLEGCPRLQLLATSRVLLHLRGETEYAVDPLRLDSAVGQPSAAAALFRERAGATRSSLSLDESNRATVEEICRRLDGLPLALELAAPQLRLFTPAQLLERLGSWLENETASAAYADLPDRQRTLRATVDWSWGLLDESARAVFARLSVFNSGFTTQAAMDVCGWDGLDVLGGLASLIDHSLVSPISRADGQPAFRMLDTIRVRARDRLAERGEEAAASQALEDYLVRSFHAIAERLHTPDQVLALRELDDHLPDLVALVSWRLAHGGTLAPLLGAVAACWVWGQIRGHLRRLPDISTRLGEPGYEDAALICWLHMGRLISSCRFEEVVGFLGDQWPLLSSLDPAMYGMALVVFGLSSGNAEGGALQVARARLEEGVAILEGSGYQPGIGYGLSHLGDALLLAGELSSARATYLRALALGRECGDLNLSAESEYHLAGLCLEEGDSDEARAHLRTASRYYLELVHLDGIGRCLAVAGAVESAQGRSARAAELLGTAAALRAPLELAPWPMIELLERRWATALQSRLGRAEFQTALDRGRGRQAAAELAATLDL